MTLEPGFWSHLARAMVRHPALVCTGAGQLVRLAPARWWRHRPFVPRPDPAYLRFRLETAYGTRGEMPVRARDVVAYLDWCRRLRRAG